MLGQPDLLPHLSSFGGGRLLEALNMHGPSFLVPVFLEPWKEDFYVKINPHTECSFASILNTDNEPLTIFMLQAGNLGRPRIPGTVNSLVRGVLGGSLRSSDERLGKASPGLSPLLSLTTERV